MLLNICVPRIELSDFFVYNTLEGFHRVKYLFHRTSLTSVTFLLFTGRELHYMCSFSAGRKRHYISRPQNRYRGPQSIGYLNLRYGPWPVSASVHARYDKLLTAIAIDYHLYSVTKRKSCLFQKGDLPSVVVGDIPNNPTLADFPYHIRIVKFLAPKFQSFTISVLVFHLL